MTACHVVLVGLMGTGKTTVGWIVAERLSRPFHDSDALIESREGRTVRDIWLHEGEPAFRKLETQVFADALASERPSVIAAGGGVVLSSDNRSTVAGADATVVWLTADTSMLLARVLTGEHRPLLDGDAEATLRAMAADREELYREIADIVVDGGERTPDEIADEIVKLVSGG